MTDADLISSLRARLRYFVERGEIEGHVDGCDALRMCRREIEVSPETRARAVTVGANLTVLESAGLPCTCGLPALLGEEPDPMADLLDGGAGQDEAMEGPER